MKQRVIEILSYRSYPRVFIMDHRVKPGDDTEFVAGPVHTRRASSPLFFTTRGRRPRFFSLRRKPKGTERRMAQSLGSALGARAPLARGARPPALHRGDFRPRVRASWDA